MAITRSCARLRVRVSKRLDIEPYGAATGRTFQMVRWTPETCSTCSRIGCPRRHCGPRSSATIRPGSTASNNTGGRKEGKEFNDCQLEHRGEERVQAYHPATRMLLRIYPGSL